MPDNEAGAHIVPCLAGEGGGADKETLRSSQTLYCRRPGSDAATGGTAAAPHRVTAVITLLPLSETQVSDR